MKDWFPLTSYDFYAYLTAGMLLMAAVDRAFLGSVLATEQDWSIVAGVFWTAVAYLIGHITAIPSSVLLEHRLARSVLASPTSVLLGFQSQRKREKLMFNFFGAREYEPFPTANRQSIIRKIAEKLSISPEAVEAESAFHTALPFARSSSDTAARLDGFLNQYGMCRNVSFASGVSGVILLGWYLYSSDRDSLALGFGALVLAVGLFGRFIKFYAAYAREVFRTFDKVC